MLWVTDETPADVNGEDPTAMPRDIEPPKTGSIFRILELIPGKEAYMHRTDTIDYAICLSGKCEMYLDDGQVIEALDLAKNALKVSNLIGSNDDHLGARLTSR